MKSVHIPPVLSTRSCVGALYIISCNDAPHHHLLRATDRRFRGIRQTLFPTKYKLYSMGRGFPFHYSVALLDRRPIEQVPVQC